MKLLLSFIVALAALQCAHAQHLVWAKQFGGIYEDYGQSIFVDAAGNVYTTGYFLRTVDFDPGTDTFNLTAAGGVDVFISKLDASGNLVWARKFGGALDDIGYSIAVDAAGNVYTTGDFHGTVDFDPGPGTFNLIAGTGDVFVSKLDASGNLVWAKKFGGAQPDIGYSIAVDGAGNVYFTGYFQGTVDFDPGPLTFNLTVANNQIKNCFITKLNAAGNLIWAKQGVSASSNYGYSIAADAAGNVYTTGFFRGTASFDLGGGTFFNLLSAVSLNVFITRHDASGNLTWAKQLGGTLDDMGYSIAVDAVGNVYATGYFAGTADFDPGPGTFNLTSADSADVFIVQLDTAGNLVWAKQFGGVSDDSGTGIATDASGNVYVTGNFRGVADFDPGPGTFNLTAAGDSDAFIAQLDASGNLVWAKQFGDTLSDYGLSIAVDAAGNMHATGSFHGTADFNPGPATFNLTTVGTWDVFVLKLSQTAPYVVQGRIFGDFNTNCNMDSSDFLSPGILVKAEPGPVYGMNDSTGNYSINLFDTGSFTISLAAQDALWQPACTTSYNLQVTTFPDTVSGIDFARTATFYCPCLTVDLGTPRLRRCFNNTYAFTYRNTGTLPASNAYVNVDFGEYLQPLNSSIPWTTVSGNVYTFPVGNISTSQQGSFSVTALLSCNAELGSTQCVTAHIYPDSLCVPPPAGWDKSETAVTGVCNNDSLVCFTIKNRSGAGTGDMNGAAQWRLYVNDTLVTQGTYQLAGQDSIVKCYPANGKTYRLEADQNPPHPRTSKPQAIVEACGSSNNFGFVNTVPQDDAHWAVETFCLEVVGSYDPNDKQVTPVGITSNKYITADDELQYMIRFQNTGTDTAFKVVIRDTIDTDALDIATLTSGSSSHDYTFNIYGQGIAEWTFNNILLPDSNADEQGSHGFVQSKIRQLPGNPDGTLIENRAAIYFDFNAPVITNTAWNEVNQGSLPVAFLSAAIDSSVNVRCFGDSGGFAATSAAGGLAPYQYMWSNGATTATASNLFAGSYSVTITDAAENSWTDSVLISEPALLEAAITSQTNVLCYANGTGEATADATGGTAPYSYEWSNSSGAQTATSLNAGTYTVTVWDAHFCTATTTSVTITEPPQLTASISTQSSVTCFGGNNAAAKANAAGGVSPYSVQWSDGQTGATANNLSAGDYQISVTDSNGCLIVTSIVIQDGYEVDAGAISGADTMDIKQNATYSVNAGMSYTWNVTNGTILSGQGTNSIEVDWTTVGQGSVLVIATEQGCADTVGKTITLIETIGIENNLLQEIELYPNPTKGSITLKSANIGTTVSLTLYDALGKQLLQQTATPAMLQQGLVLDISAWKDGIFFLSFRTGEATGVRKIAKY